MSDFTFHVDTRPMAESVDSVSQQVTVVGTALTAMQAAVVKAEKEAADQICRNIDGGFFLLIRSKLSRSISEYSSAINSQLISMMETGKAIERMHDQMEGDFHAIKKRYMKLFSSLDKELETRVHELDKPAAQLAAKRDQLITGRIRSDQALTLCQSNDMQTTLSVLQSARIKRRTERFIEAASQNVQETQNYRNRYAGIMSGSSGEKGEVCVPVLYAEQSSMFEGGGSVGQIYAPEHAPESLKSRIDDVIDRQAAAIPEQSEREKEEIRAAFLKMIDEAGLDQRIAERMAALYDGGSL